MTRDEAVKKAGGNLVRAIEIVTALEALGILKLDDPKTPEDHLYDALTQLDDDFGLDANDVLTAIKSSGLKVVRA